jgi:hypothetical protein
MKKKYQILIILLIIILIYQFYFKKKSLWRRKGITIMKEKKNYLHIKKYEKMALMYKTVKKQHNRDYSLKISLSFTPLKTFKNDKVILITNVYYEDGTILPIFINSTNLEKDEIFEECKIIPNLTNVTKLFISFHIISENIGTEIIIHHINVKENSSKKCNENELKPFGYKVDNFAFQSTQKFVLIYNKLEKKNNHPMYTHKNPKTSPLVGYSKKISRTNITSILYGR